jgi:hypothetical protein
MGEMGKRAGLTAGRHLGEMRHMRRSIGNRATWTAERDETDEIGHGEKGGCESWER